MEIDLYEIIERWANETDWVYTSDGIEMPDHRPYLYVNGKNCRFYGDIYGDHILLEDPKVEPIVTSIRVDAADPQFFKKLVQWVRECGVRNNSV